GQDHKGQNGERVDDLHGVKGAPAGSGIGRILTRGPPSPAPPRPLPSHVVGGGRIGPRPARAPGDPHRWGPLTSLPLPSATWAGRAASNSFWCRPPICRAIFLRRRSGPVMTAPPPPVPAATRPAPTA
ncbi:MAG: hypothetical protein ACK56I_21355, partial [bacterium]